MASSENEGIHEPARTKLSLLQLAAMPSPIECR
jgi:hypothetical protein